MEQKIKLGIRYVIIGFVMYLAYIVTGVSYVKELGPDYATTVQVIVGAVFGAFAVILKWHFDSKVEK